MKLLSRIKLLLGIAGMLLCWSLVENLQQFTHGLGASPYIT